MPATSLDLKGISVQITDATGVSVTEVEQDDDGYYYRDIHVLGEPELSGSPSPVVATLRIRALSEEGIEVTAPEQKF